MKMQKLNARGVAHHFLLALIVVGVAVGGTYYLIASHADTCPTSGVMSSPTSSESVSCQPASSLTASTPRAALATCTISSVPARPSADSTLSPTLTITNTSAQTITGASVSEAFTVDNKAVNNQTVNLSDLAPGASWNDFLYQYDVPVATSASEPAVYHVVNSSLGIDCKASFTLPTTT